MKYILSILIMLFTLTASAIATLPGAPYPELSTGITTPVPTPINDFSSFSGIAAADSMHTVSTEANGYIAPYSLWYQQDFSGSPFDGNIEIYLVGTPLPDFATTCFILLAFAGIIYWYRFKYKLA